MSALLLFIDTDELGSNEASTVLQERKIQQHVREIAIEDVLHFIIGNTPFTG
jgi:hypothetical protein